MAWRAQNDAIQAEIAQARSPLPMSAGAAALVGALAGAIPKEPPCDQNGGRASEAEHATALGAVVALLGSEGSTFRRVSVICVPDPATPPTIEAAALDALADALAPRIFARLKRLADEERERDADDADTIDFLAGIGVRVER